LEIRLLRNRPKASRNPALAAATVVSGALAGLTVLTLGGCAVAPEIPVINRLTHPQVITETVYVPIYVEVEKQVPAPVRAPEPIKLPDDQDQALALLVEMARAGNGSADDSRKELAAAQALYNKDRSSVNRMRFALYTAMTASTSADDARLQGLLEPLVAKVGGLANSHPLRPVAEAMLAQLNDRNRLVREQSKKVDELQQKLDALKAIEKQLLDRDRRRN
jgi:hypothetical protein